MGNNAIVLGKNSVTNAVENTKSTEQALHVFNPFDPALVGSSRYGLTSRNRVFTIGRSTTVQNVYQDLWEGPTNLYVTPTVAQQMRVVSTSANDSLAGTGTQKIIIHYLDANYIEKSEIVDMNGLTHVNTVATDIFRINNVHSYQVGSALGSIGAISVTNLGSTVTYSFMGTGQNTSRQAVYTVPAGKTYYINHWQASVGTVIGVHFTRVFLASTSHEGVFLPGVSIAVDEVGLQSNSIAITFPTPIPIPAMADIKMSAISDASNANAYVVGTFMGFLETNV